MAKPVPTPPPIISCVLDPKAITVGQKMKLTCALEGSPAGAHPSSVQFSDLNKASPYTLQFLGQPIVDAGRLEQVLTSYRAGHHDITQLHAKIDGSDFLISPQSLEVQSLVQKETTPFPVVEPRQVAAPWWWWVLWGVLAAALLGFIIREILRWRRERKKRVAVVPEKELTLAEKFALRIRKLESQGLHLKGSYKAFALELTAILKQSVGAKLNFPAEDMTTEEFMDVLKKNHKKFFESAGQQMEAVMESLDKIKFAKVETSPEHCVSLLDLANQIGKFLFGEKS